VAAHPAPVDRRCGYKCRLCLSPRHLEQCRRQCCTPDVQCCWTGTQRGRSSVDSPPSPGRTTRPLAGGPRITANRPLHLTVTDPQILSPRTRFQHPRRHNGASQIRPISPRGIALLAAEHSEHPARRPRPSCPRHLKTLRSRDLSIRILASPGSRNRCLSYSDPSRPDAIPPRRVCRRTP